MFRKLTSKELKEQQYDNQFFAALRTDQQLGYDLPFIIDRSTQKLSIVRSAAKYNETVYVQIKNIEELPACIFTDAQYLLNISLTPDQKQQMCNGTLNEFCKLHKVEEKETMSYEMMNKLLITKGSDLIDVFSYSIQDSVVLDKLFQKTQILTKHCEIAMACNTSIMDVFHKSKIQLLVHNLHSIFRSNKI